MSKEKTGDSPKGLPQMANQLTPFIGDANTKCPEFKSFLVNLEQA